MKHAAAVGSPAARRHVQLDARAAVASSPVSYTARQAWLGRRRWPRADRQARQRGLGDHLTRALRAQLEALDTWRRWAWGDSIDVQHLGATVEILLDATGEHVARYGTLGHAVQQWAVDAGIFMPVRESGTLAPEVAGPELGL